MASLLDSTATFETRAKEHGLPASTVAILLARGVDTLNKAAFAVGTPGSQATEEELRALVAPPATDEDAEDPAEVSAGVLASLRRLIFESQTMALANLKLQVEGGDADRKKDMPLEEISTRLRDQKARLRGLELSGALEVSHSAYQLVFRMFQENAISYLKLERFGTRAAEVAQERSPKELVVDATSHLQVRSAPVRDACVLSSDLALAQALTRRSLALDVSFFECLEKIELYCSKETTSKCCGEQNICLLFQCLPFCTTYFQRLISFMLVHAGFVFTYTPVAAGPLRGQDARKVLLEADRLFSKKGGLA